MKSIKKHVIGVLEVDPSSKKLWLNTIDGKCLIRISGLEFKNHLQKFSQLDISKGTAHMIPYDESETEAVENNLTIFFTKIINLVFMNMNSGKFRGTSRGFQGLYSHVVSYFKEKE